MLKTKMGESDITMLWSRETVPKVMKIIISTLRLPQRDIISLLLVSSSLNHTLITSPSLWLVNPNSNLFKLGHFLFLILDYFHQVLDFHEMNNAGDRLLAALALVCLHFS